MNTFIVAYGTNVFTVTTRDITAAKKLCPGATVSYYSGFNHEGLLPAFKQAMGMNG